MLLGTVMASAGGQRVLNVVSLLLLLTSGVTSGSVNFYTISGKK